MTDTPQTPDDDSLPEAEADERFNRLVGNLVNTPHTPHKGSAVEADDGASPEAS
jgi:hypothetical protein